MPPSQLKALKAQLREKGIVGPQKSKQQRKSGKANGASNHQDRHAVLQQIRDSFNPFELRAGSARPAKFDSVSVKNSSGKYAAALHRPGVTKSAGEEMRRQQLLPEMRKRNKVGGLVDRRIGEGDLSMTPEERAVQRFAREKSKKRGASLFDLEASDNDEPKVGLTHLGRSLDDFAEDDLAGEGSEGSSADADGLLRKKRRRPDEEDEENEPISIDDVAEPERKKTKKEVMEEVIAKSKLYKYERQKAKEDDDDIREQLDAGTADLLALLRGRKPVLKEVESKDDTVGRSDGPKMDPERQKLLESADRATVDKEYEVRLRQLAQDTRAKPSDRTKTAEEKAQEEAERLQKMEADRLKRMQGEDVTDEESDEQEEGDAEPVVEDKLGNYETHDDAANFGLTSSTARTRETEEKVVHEDEDEFAIDDELIADESDLEDSSATESHSENGQINEANEDDGFVADILSDTGDGVAGNANHAIRNSTTRLAYTYACPRSHPELLQVLQDVPEDQINTVVQRIRALHHPSLAAANRDAMADFSVALVDHIAYMADNDQSLLVAEQLIRHVHSLSRNYATRVGEAFRKHLQAWHGRPGAQPKKGDLVLVTGIGSTYSTSDHFHQVVTPAITLMARWLGLTAVESEMTGATGAFFVAQCLSYQALARRYVPEAVKFTLSALISPSISEKRAHLDNLLAMADMWRDKSAFIDVFNPAVPLLHNLNAQKELQHLQILLQQFRLRRRPLELHHHRPLPIRMSIPKFEEGFNPDKHYDPDKDRSDAKKLQKEYKRERKGALRELRKDANFIAREQLREKRERDAEYERKQRRLIAEIQGEEGRESKAYEREKMRRKREKKA